MPATVEELSKQPEVHQEIERTPSKKKPGEKPKARVRDKFSFVTCALLFLGCAILYYLVGRGLVPVPRAQFDLARRILRGAALIVIILALAKVLTVYTLGRIED